MDTGHEHRARGSMMDTGHDGLQHLSTLLTHSLKLRPTRRFSGSHETHEQAAVEKASKPFELPAPILGEEPWVVSFNSIRQHVLAWEKPLAGHDGNLNPGTLNLSKRQSLPPLLTSFTP